MSEFIDVLVGGLLQGCIYAVIALGFSLIYRVTGVVNLAQGGFSIVGALLSFSFEKWWGLPVLAAVPAAVAVTAVLAALIAGSSFVPGARKLPPGNMLMLTAGVLTALEGLVLVIWGSQPYAVPAFSGERPVNIAGVLIPSQGLWVAGAAVAVVALLLALLRTRLGRVLLAASENPVAARLMGVNVEAVVFFAFVFSAAIGALAGAVVAPAASLEFDSGRALTISGFVAVAIGGIGSIPGAIAGGLLLGVLNEFGAAYVSSLFSSALTLTLLLFVLIIRPAGLLGARETRRTDVREDLRVHRRALRMAPADRNVALATTAVALAVLPLVLPSGGLLASVTIALILYIALMGLDLLVGYTGQISLGQAAFMATGGYTSALLSTRFGVPPILGIVAGVGVSAACALLLSMITLRLRGLYLALATLAFGLLIDSGTVGLERLTGGPSGLSGVPAFSLLGVSFASPVSMYYLVLGVVAVVFVALGGVVGSRYGRAMSAVRTDQVAAAALGIRVVRLKLGVFIGAAVLASVAGSLYAYNFRFLSPDMVGTSRSLELISMLVIGGEGTLLGPLLGALLLTLLPTIFQPLAAYKTLIEGVLLVGVFLVSPQGIIGLVAPLMSSRKAAQAAALDAVKEAA